MPNLQTAIPANNFNIINRVDTLFVSLTDARDFLQLFGDTSQDAEVRNFLGGAQELAEGIIGQELFPTTFNAYYPFFPSTGCVLPRPNLVATQPVTVSYYDNNNTLQTLPSTAYAIDPTNTFPIVFPTNLAGNVTASDTFANPWVITFTAQLPEAGNPDSGAIDRVRQAILMFLGDMYSNRVTDQVGTVSSISVTTAERLLRKYRPATL